MSLSIQRITPGNKIHQLFQNGQSGTSAPSKVGPSSLQTKIFIKCRFPGSKKSEVSPKNAIHYIILLNRVTWRLHFKYFFCPKTGDSFLKRWKITNILLQITFHVKNMIFFGVFGQKTGRAGQIILKLSTMRNQVFERKNLENENFMAVALHAQIGFRRSDQSQSSTPGQTINGGPVLRYFLSETIQAQENGSRGTHFAKFLISISLRA